MSKKNPVPFQSTHKGKCDTCETLKPLDMMLRKDYQKGLYECLDCKCHKEAKYSHYLIELDKPLEIRKNTEKSNKNSILDISINKKTNKLKKVILWAVG